MRKYNKYVRKRTYIDPISKAFGHWACKERKAQKLFIYTVADHAELSERGVRKIERGECNFSFSAAVRICYALDTELEKVMPEIRRRAKIIKSMENVGERTS